MVDEPWETDVCYECTGYGDDYGIDENGELVCRCEECAYNPINREWNDD